MNLAILTADTLKPVADAFAVVTTTKVHPEWFPYVWASTLHAARISVAFQSFYKRGGSSLSWGTNAAGFLIMCWGGTFWGHVMLGIPPPMLYSFDPWINYLTVHIFLTTFFSLFPSALNTKLFDTVLFPIDAILRVNSVTLTLNHLNNPHVNAAYVSSPLSHMILGAIASAGGGLSGATLNVWTPEWKFGTPPVFKAGAGLWGTLDVWGGSLVAVIYSLTTAHPAFNSLSTFLLSFAKANSLSGVASLTPLGAKALSTAVLGTLFGIRVFKNHWLSPSPSAPPTAAMRRKFALPAAEPSVPANNVGGATLGGGLAKRGKKKLV